MDKKIKYIVVISLLTFSLVICLTITSPKYDSIVVGDHINKAKGLFIDTKPMNLKSINGNFYTFDPRQIKGLSWYDGKPNLTYQQPYTFEVDKDGYIKQVLRHHLCLSSQKRLSELLKEKP